MSWADRKTMPTRAKELDSPPRIQKIRIRRKVGARGFFHAGKVVEEGQEIECDGDIAASQIAIGKAEGI